MELVVRILPLRAVTRRMLSRFLLRSWRFSGLCLLLLAGFSVSTRAADAPAKNIPVADVPAFKARLLAATTKHLNMLLGADGSVAALKGKGADGEEALTFYRMFEITGDQR